MVLKKNQRICIGTSEVCGILWKLSRAFDRMGIENKVYLFQSNKYIGDKKPEYHNSELKYYQKISEYAEHAREHHHMLLFFGWQFIQIFTILPVFFRSLTQFDAYIYVFTEGFFRRNPYLARIEIAEFFLLKVFHKKVITLCCGSDTRAPYLDVVNSTGELKKMAAVTRRHAKRVHMLDKYTIVVDNPATANMHCRPYINYHCIGNPVDESECIITNDQRKKKRSGPVVLFHAPSVPEVKGTYQIRAVIERIKKKGYQIEYREKSGVPHEEILEEMRGCDILVNQLYSDTPLSMVDVEAGLNRVPTVTCGYYAKYFRKEVPGKLPPNCFCEPDELEEKLIYYIEHPDARKELGELTYEYIKEHLMSEHVAKKILKIAEANVPEEWIFNPEKSTYIWGCGVSKKKVKERVHYMIKHHGMNSLQVPASSNFYKRYKRLYHYINEQEGEK